MHRAEHFAPHLHIEIYSPFDKSCLSRGSRYRKPDFRWVDLMMNSSRWHLGSVMGGVASSLAGALSVPPVSLATASVVSARVHAQEHLAFSPDIFGLNHRPAEGNLSCKLEAARDGTAASLSSTLRLKSSRGVGDDAELAVTSMLEEWIAADAPWLRAISEQFSLLDAVIAERVYTALSREVQDDLPLDTGATIRLSYMLCSQESWATTSQPLREADSHAIALPSRDRSVEVFIESFPAETRLIAVMPMVRESEFEHPSFPKIDRGTYEGQLFKIEVIFASSGAPLDNDRCARSIRRIMSSAVGGAAELWVTARLEESALEDPELAATQAVSRIGAHQRDPRSLSVITRARLEQIIESARSGDRSGS